MSAQPYPGQSGRISDLVDGLQPSGIRKFFDLVATMDGVISLGVGEPDFATPWTISTAAIAALELGRTNYTSNHGILPLRRAVSQHLARLYGVEYDPAEEILVTVGVSEGLDLALRAILNPGDEVLVPEPCFVSYVPAVALAHGRPVPIPSSAEEGFVPPLERIAAAVTPRTKAILFGSPGNPTGAVIARRQLVQLVELARRHDLVLISDEIYDRLRYGDEPHTCVSALPGARDRTILLNGFSKAYAMTGWRIGYACAPADILAAMVKVHQYTMMCASVMSQEAALEALRRGEPAVQRMVKSYDQRRRVIVDGFNAAGLPCRMPEGAFYTFPSIAGTGLSSEEFCARLLAEEKVAVVPGSAFGACGEGHFRATFATGDDELREAIARVGRFVKRLRP